ncbi:MAG: magnesium transporter CorA family protein, partial [Anaerolineales bacterium]|nr:magnesium transporter CorA family protein [Anaerolineales bacterium]
MITIYKSGENGIETLEGFLPGSWVHVENPDDGEIEHLFKELEIPRDFVKSSLDIDERPRTDNEGGITLILIRTPVFRGKSADIPYLTIPLGIIIADGIFVTVCKEENEIIQDFVDGRVSNLSIAKINRSVLRIFLQTAKRYLRHLRDIDREVDSLEDMLQRSLRNEELIELLKYQKSLVYFTTALRSNELMMERLQRGGLFENFPDDTDLLEDVLTENQQAIEMVGISNNILSQMMDAFASIISNNLNVVMKFLTSATIVLMFPTLVASFYGMNVELPLQNSPFAFI